VQVRAQAGKAADGCALLAEAEGWNLNRLARLAMISGWAVAVDLSTNPETAPMLLGLVYELTPLLCLCGSSESLGALALVSHALVTGSEGLAQMAQGLEVVTTSDDFANLVRTCPPPLSEEVMGTPLSAEDLRILGWRGSDALLRELCDARHSDPGLRTLLHARLDSLLRSLGRAEERVTPISILLERANAMQFAAQARRGGAGAAFSCVHAELLDLRRISDMLESQRHKTALMRACKPAVDAVPTDEGTLARGLSADARAHLDKDAAGRWRVDV